MKTIFETSDSDYSPKYNKKGEHLDDIHPDIQRKGFLTLAKKPQGKQVRENTLEKKLSKQDSIPIKSSIAAPVVAIPNFQPAINDDTNSIAAQKLVEYPGTNCPFLLTDDTINNESFIVSMRVCLDKTNR